VLLANPLKNIAAASVNDSTCVCRFGDVISASVKKPRPVRYPHIPWLPLLFYPALPVAAAVGLLLWREWPPALTQIVPFVPWVMALIGVAVCLMYQRAQTMVLMLSVLAATAAWPALATEAPWAVGPALAWWSLAYTINALWSERSSMLLDLAARIGMIAAGAAAIALAGKDGVNDLLGMLSVQGRLAHLSVPIEGLIALLATGLTLTLLLLRYGRPQQAGQWLGFVCMAWALPRGAEHPVELALMSTAALTALCISLAHEGFHMAFRDELTGLPGRRALNERLQRMGRVYTLAMADVDNFKAFNDTHGHDVGDQVLRMVAAQLRPGLPLRRRGIHAGVPGQDRGGKHAAPGKRQALHRGLPDAPARQAGAPQGRPDRPAPPRRARRAQCAAAAGDSQHRRSRTQRRPARARRGDQGGGSGSLQSQGRRPQSGAGVQHAAPDWRGLMRRRYLPASGSAISASS
jgi:hypothetical protein